MYVLVNRNRQLRTKIAKAMAVVGGRTGFCIEFSDLTCFFKRKKRDGQASLAVQVGHRGRGKRNDDAKKSK